MVKCKKKKTGVQTPEFRKPTPPPPPMSGSNAIKPSCNCGHQPTYTSTQNPPDTFSSLLKATSLQILPNDISTITYVCPYETPCGWCCKWDKKCDKKIGLERGQRVNINPVGDAIDEPIGIIVNKICASESDHEWECVGISTGGSTYRCRKCYEYKTIPIKTEILETYIGGCQ